jgi:hypothetical protein
MDIREHTAREAGAATLADHPFASYIPGKPAAYGLGIVDDPWAEPGAELEAGT